jgi:hypothetical protein
MHVDNSFWFPKKLKETTSRSFYFPRSKRVSNGAFFLRLSQVNKKAGMFAVIFRIAIGWGAQLEKLIF